MIQYFRTSGNKVINSELVEKDCWINVTNPSSQEIDYLSQKLLIPTDFLMDPLDSDESPRTEQHKNCLLIVLRVPLELGGESELPFTTIPIGIILKRDLIVTVCGKPTEVIQSFIENRIRNFSSAKR
jgi:magnesium transporter